ncbi:hypothetical protein [Arthrobacter sp. H14-L1]|uniref:hypothetical protein n=1 Tax=Arthrobacter sp. H14-L1 TaxID=2996697 RepID=UPI00226DFA3E|nr:hypothetical protein [Arthrobacter sp. H14-L1]MCY0906557.1 hypothetical protein [Arthrobacter sp. H14-L1]
MEPGYLTIRLYSLPTRAKTTAIAELCEHLTATKPATPAPTSSYGTRSKTPHHLE